MNTQRNFIGFEMDKGYYDIACKRIEDHKEETNDLPAENGGNIWKSIRYTMGTALRV